ncbi:DUF4393 domain-containing protein [Carnobacterium antarcticum]|uniref:DUF4393 domain-containing protein n=1 Tax=Carnobacterium antarcticum TaxID=2126436 RepID=A0ABW4NM77_9LACT|nr:DUF4393 domain-containing protein [Carnobacterium sp. CP1]ALV21068.1 Phage protein [Carnobacterium sp. CP1]
MTDNKLVNINLIPDLPESTKEELLNPSANLVGQAFKGIAHKVLGPLVRYNIVKDAELEDFTQKVRNKTAAVPIENRSSEKIGLAYKAVEDAAYQLDSEELREMFANLISATVDSEVNQLVHPSFSTILKDLSPKDASLFKEMHQSETLPLVSLKLQTENGDFNLNDIENIILGNNIKFTEQVSLNNLERFGLVKISPDIALVSPDNEFKYEEFEKTTYFKDEKSKLPISVGEYTFEVLTIIRGNVAISPLGKQFAKIVISES